MTITESPPEARPDPAPVAMPDTGLYRLITTGDHKLIGRVYIGFALLYFLATAVVGGLVGVERLDLTDIDLFSDDASAFQAVQFHRFGLLFLVVAPLFVGLATAIVPLQVGSTAIAFPRAAAAAMWVWVVGSITFLVSFLVDGGLGTVDPTSTDREVIALTLLSLGLMAVALVLASICLATTVIALRTGGMTLRRVPLFSWSTLVSSAIWIFSLPVLVANLVIVYVDLRGRAPVKLGLETAIPAQLDWVVSQPQVFAFAIPALGILGDVIPVSAGVRQKQHDVMLVAIGLFGLLGFGAFAQDAFSRGELRISEEFVFIAMGFAIVLPVLMLAGGWADTLRRGRMRGVPPAALVGSIVALLLLLGGVVSGALRVIDGLDLGGTTADRAVWGFVVAASLAAAIAGIFHWQPKLTGRLLPRPAGLLAALLVLVGGAAMAVPDLVTGFLDQADAVAQGEVDDGVEALNAVSMVGAWVLVAAALVVVLAVAGEIVRRGATAGDDPWGGHTLEWATSSPPPDANFAEPPAIVRSETPLLDQEEDD